MNPPERRDPQPEIDALRERLSLLGQASLRITQDLDFNSVLQGALDSARSLTNARYGVIVLHDGAGVPAEFLSSGMTPEETERLWTAPGWPQHFGYLALLPEPLRVPDLTGHLRSLGLPELQPPVEVSARVSFLAFPVSHQGERVGSIFLAEKQDGQQNEAEFSREDEDTLALFAAQAALAIANARQHREERRARAGLETLVDTSPVGVAVLDAATGSPRSFNREALRIVEGLRDPDQAPEDLLNTVTFRRADGREFSLREFPLAGLLSSGETVRAEEIVLRVPDGRSVSVLLNATPIRSQEGGVESFVVTLQDLTPLEEAERLRADFLAMVSHELLAPLTSIKGSAATLTGFGHGPGAGPGPPVLPHHRGPGGPHEGAGLRPAGRGPHRDGGFAGQPRTGGGGPCWWTGPAAPSPAPGGATPWSWTCRRACPWCWRTGGASSRCWSTC